MSGKDPRSMSIEEIRDALIDVLNRQADLGYEQRTVVLKTAFDTKIAEAQTNAAAQQATAAGQQAAAAQALNRVTRALFAVAAVQAALIVIQILVSLKVIG